MDEAIFGEDGFTTPDLWEGLEIFLIVVDDEVVGSIALRHNTDVPESYDDDYPEREGSLYIVSTGIMPQWQGRGIGNDAKAWEVNYAREHGFARIVTNARSSNERSIRLNKKFGLKKVRVISNFYEEPTEDAVVLELVL